MMLMSSFNSLSFTKMYSFIFDINELISLVYNVSISTVFSKIFFYLPGSGIDLSTI